MTRALKIYSIGLLACAWAGVSFAEEPQAPAECFESRKDYTIVQKREIEPGLPNVKCSDRTGGVLWWGDPYDNTVPMGEMPVMDDPAYATGEAVVKSRTKHLKYFMPCTVCHNGTMVPVPKSKRPRPLNMHQDIVPDAMNLRHGRGAIWCLDCHNPVNRDTLISNFGDPISFDQPQKLCGKCHGPIYRDWREGIHGKRIGGWEAEGKKRWWVCTECHNPHDMDPPFKELEPEKAPALPKTMKNANHERHGGHGPTEGAVAGQEAGH